MMIDDADASRRLLLHPGEGRLLLLLQLLRACDSPAPPLPPPLLRRGGAAPAARRARRRCAAYCCALIRCLLLLGSALSSCRRAVAQILLSTGTVCADEKCLSVLPNSALAIWVAKP